jgi:hypothetical protein
VPAVAPPPYTLDNPLAKVVSDVRQHRLGKRFGYLEAKVIASRVLQRFGLETASPEPPRMRWSATLQPRGGLRMLINTRSSRPAPSTRWRRSIDR